MVRMHEHERAGLAMGALICSSGKYMRRASTRHHVRTDGRLSLTVALLSAYHSQLMMKMHLNYMHTQRVPIVSLHKLSEARSQRHACHAVLCMQCLFAFVCMHVIIPTLSWLWFVHSEVFLSTFGRFVRDHLYNPFRHQTFRDIERQLRAD